MRAARGGRGAGAGMTPEGIAPASSARAVLRVATAATHERLHHLPVLAALAEGRISRGAYLVLLRRMLGFHAAAEAALAAAPSLAPFGIDLAERRRTGLLRADLAVLGAAAGPVAEAPFPAARSAAEAMGCLYVLEGSTLGGRQLARGLDRLLGPGPAGRAFLLGYGPRHGAMWQGFCAALERCGAKPGGLAGMIAGAEAGFAAFEAWFAAPGWAAPAAAA